MYLYLGMDTLVRKSDIVGIFDLDTATVSRHTRNFLSRAEKNKEVISITNELPKSFILCKNGEKESLYISQISTATLKKRAEYIEELANR